MTTDQNSRNAHAAALVAMIREREAEALEDAANALRAEHDPCEPECTACGTDAEGDSVAAWLDARAAERRRADQ